MRSFSPLLIGLMVLVTSCSKYKEHCHAVGLGALSARNDIAEMKSASRKGDAAAFETASKALQVDLAQIAAPAVETKGLKGESLKSFQETAPAGGAAFTTAQRELLKWVEANPDQAPTATYARAGVDPKLEEEASSFEVSINVQSTMPCD